jgi:hypothetical protein
MENAERAIPVIIRDTVKRASIEARNAAIKICPVSAGWTTRGGQGKIAGRLPGGKGYVVKGNFKTHAGGMLQKSLNFGGQNNIYEIDPRQPKITYGSKLPYAESIFGDTPPYVIRPRSKKFLYFAVSSTTALLVKSVTHPGGIKTTGGGTGKGGFGRIADALERQAAEFLDASLNFYKGKIF